jgi:hypothetical protein
LIKFFAEISLSIRLPDCERTRMAKSRLSFAIDSTSSTANAAVDSGSDAAS